MEIAYIMIAGWMIQIRGIRGVCCPLESQHSCYITPCRYQSALGRVGQYILISRAEMFLLLWGPAFFPSGIILSVVFSSFRALARTAPFAGSPKLELLRYKRILLGLLLRDYFRVNLRRIFLPFIGR